MKIRIVKSLQNKTWDSFVDNSNNGTIFHKLRFFQYHPKKAFQYYNLCFFEKEKLTAVLPAALQDKILFSPMGSSYGSFVTSDLTMTEHEVIIDSLLSFAREKGIREVHLTPPPLIYLKSVYEHDNFLLQYKGFKIARQLISHAVDLTDLTESKRFRNDVQRSLKSKMTVEMNTDFEQFYPLLLKNKQKFNTKPTHTYEQILLLHSLFPEKIKLLMAYDQDKSPIAGILLFVCNAQTVLTFYICQNYNYQHYKPVSRLLYEAKQWSRERKYRWLDLGVSMDTQSQNPMEPSRSLVFFKESVGARGFLRTTFTYAL